MAFNNFDIFKIITKIKYFHKFRLYLRVVFGMHAQKVSDSLYLIYILFKTRNSVHYLCLYYLNFNAVNFDDNFT